MMGQILLAHDLTKALADLTRSARQAEAQTRRVMKRGEVLTLRMTVRAVAQDAQRAEQLLTQILGEAAAS